FELARTTYARSREIHEELGRRFRIATVASLIASDIEQWAGRPDEAAVILSWAYDTVREMGALSATATIAGFYADALGLVGRNEEADPVSRFAEEHAPTSDIVTQVLWRTARARAGAERDPEAAETIAREAAALARNTDYVDIEARALACLAHVVGPGAERSSL